MSDHDTWASVARVAYRTAALLRAEAVRCSRDPERASRLLRRAHAELLRARGWRDALSEDGVVDHDLDELEAEARAS